MKRRELLEFLTCVKYPSRYKLLKKIKSKSDTLYKLHLVLPTSKRFLDSTKDGVIIEFWTLPLIYQSFSLNMM